MRKNASFFAFFVLTNIKKTKLVSTQKQLSKRAHPFENK